MFKTICVDHVGIACKDLDLSKKFYTEVLGLSCTGEEAVPEQGVKPYLFPVAKLCLSSLLISLKMAMALSANTSLKMDKVSNISLFALMMFKQLLIPLLKRCCYDRQSSSWRCWRNGYRFRSSEIRRYFA